MLAPQFFHEIKEEQAGRWQKLDADEQMAAPWRQLFRQLTQTPIHVLSELLQNADDSGATTARAFIQDDVFVFEHNGTDFSPDDFRSLCRFGFSNKRSLLTIGYRGIGFKSAFSLGPVVRVRTPSLSFSFSAQRFTEPNWEEPDALRPGIVRIEVPISERRRGERIQENMRLWLASPASLLFFHHLKSIELQGQRMEAIGEEAGPTSAARWTTIRAGNKEQRVLFVRSEQEAFPEEALNEVRSERGVDAIELPPCSVDVVCGLTGTQRLYAVLPTQQEIAAPFSCNAPFVQDPARTSIKDPSVSATNRWLLRRCGEVAAETMRQWLQGAGSLRARSAAYALLPARPAPDASQGDASAKVVSAFMAMVKEEPLALGLDGRLHAPADCPPMPREFLAAWEQADLARLCGLRVDSFLAPEIENQHVENLRRWNFVQSTDLDLLLSRLQRISLPRPKEDQALLRVWAKVASFLGRKARCHLTPLLRLVPVESSPLLQPSEEVLRLDTSKGEMSSGTSFLRERLPIVDERFLDLLSSGVETNDIVGEREDDEQETRFARQFVMDAGLDKFSTPNQVWKLATERVFGEAEPDFDVALQLTHHVAAEGLSPPDALRFLCRDGRWRGAAQTLMTDEGSEPALLPSDWLDAHVIDSRYLEPTALCDQDSWQIWVESPHSPFARFALPEARTNPLTDRIILEAFVEERGGARPAGYRYRREYYEVHDYVFPESVRAHWRQLALTEEDVWLRVAMQLLRAATPKELLSRAGLRVTQKHYQHTAKLDCANPRAAWVHELMGLPCLPDSNREAAVPAELMRETRLTSPFRGIEKFLLETFDTPDNEPLLDLLGVQSSPAGHDHVVDRLRELRLHKGERREEDIRKWVLLLDRTVERMSADQRAEVIARFNEEALIPGNDGSWYRADEVFVWPDEHLDGLPCIMAGVKELGVWRLVGVRARPSAELLLDNLQKLEPGQALSGSELAWVRRALGRLGQTVVSSCNAWLSIGGRWVDFDSATHLARRRKLTSAGRIFPGIADKILDFAMMEPESEWSPLPNAEKEMRWRLTESGQYSLGRQPVWFEAIVNCLRRVAAFKGDDIALTDLTERVGRSQWVRTNGISVTPFLGPDPIAEAQARNAAWIDEKIWVREGVGDAEVVNELVREVATPFHNEEIELALRMTAFRSPDFIESYFRAHFQMAEDVPALTGSEQDGDTHKDVQSLGESLAVGTTAGGTAAVEGASAVAAKSTSVGRSATATTDMEKSDAAEDARAQGSRLVKAFAESRNLRWDPQCEQYAGDDGALYRLERDELFQWAFEDAEGDQLQISVAERGDLQRGVVVATEHYEGLKRKLDSALLAHDGKAPVLLRSEDFVRCLEQGDLQVFPASYRVRRGE